MAGLSRLIDGGKIKNRDEKLVRSWEIFVDEFKCLRFKSYLNRVFS
jgi:hypothetical protein